MGRLGVLYHMDTCIACGACQTACKDGHGLIGGEFFRRVEMIETDEGYLPYSGACCHCGNPMCVSACPTGAMHKTEEGAVVHDDGLCIGCGACVWNCPYGAVSFSRLKGVSQKCDSCIEPVSYTHLVVSAGTYPLPPGKIYNSNLQLILSRLQELGIWSMVGKQVGDSSKACLLYTSRCV